jgi:hypothetical protein
LIENHIQVYCERCGSPFILEGVTFKPAPTPVLRKFGKTFTLSKKESSNLDKFIQFLNKISFLPLILFTFISFGLIVEIAFNLDNWGMILLNRLIPGLIGFSLLIYDWGYINPKIKEKKYNEVFLDSFCWGILGCVLYGIGVLILIKGIFVLLYVMIKQENKNLKAYDYGLLAKNSINNLSSKAGFVIILMSIFTALSDGLYIPAGDSITIPFPFYFEIPIILLVYIGLLIISSIALIIDRQSRTSIGIKQKFEFGESVKVIVIGIIGSVFYAAGIFILLKGILIFFLFVGKPSEKSLIRRLEQKSVYEPQVSRETEKPLKKVGGEKEKQFEEPIRGQETAEITPLERNKIPTKETEFEEKPIITEKSEVLSDKKDREKKEEDIELRLHESLLPVKDEKDKKLVKEYFSKIFSVMSKDLREQISNLKISQKEKRKLLEELAFLTKEEQVKYIEVLVDLYKEIPKKLIERIQKLPNVNVKHLDKIVEQLRQMDFEEQLKFVQFLEENA